MLGEHLRREHAITYGLDRLSQLADKFGTIPLQFVTPAEYPALAFAAQITSLIDFTSPAEADKLRGRVRGAFGNSDDMRGLSLELRAVTHFLRSGYRTPFFDFPL